MRAQQPIRTHGQLSAYRHLSSLRDMFFAVLRSCHKTRMAQQTLPASVKNTHLFSNPGKRASTLFRIEWVDKHPQATALVCSALNQVRSWERLYPRAVHQP